MRTFWKDGDILIEVVVMGIHVCQNPSTMHSLLYINFTLKRSGCRAEIGFEKVLNGFWQNSEQAISVDR